MIYYVVFVLQNIMILGDFNADGRYLLDEKKKKIRIRSAYYCWLIGDDVDTTTSNSNDHTYDRYHHIMFCSFNVEEIQSVLLECLPPRQTQWMRQANCLHGEHSFGRK